MKKNKIINENKKTIRKPKKVIDKVSSIANNFEKNLRETSITSFTRYDIEDTYKCSFSTAARVIKKLEEKGILFNQSKDIFYNLLNTNLSNTKKVFKIIVPYSTRIELSVVADTEEEALQIASKRKLYAPDKNKLLENLVLDKKFVSRKASEEDKKDKD